MDQRCITNESDTDIQNALDKLRDTIFDTVAHLDAKQTEYENLPPEDKAGTLSPADNAILHLQLLKLKMSFGDVQNN